MAAQRAARDEVTFSDGWKTPGIHGSKPGDQVLICRETKAYSGGNCCGAVYFIVTVTEVPSGEVVRTIGHHKGSAAYVPAEFKTPDLEQYEMEDF